MLVTLSGSSMVVKELRPENALSPMLVTVFPSNVSGILTTESLPK